MVNELACLTYFNRGDAFTILQPLVYWHVMEVLTSKGINAMRWPASLGTHGMESPDSTSQYVIYQSLLNVVETQPETSFYFICFWFSCHVTMVKIFRAIAIKAFDTSIEISSERYLSDIC